MPLALKRVIVFVADVPKCAAFYTKHFGLKPVDVADEGWAELTDSGGARLAFHQAHGAKGKIKTPTGSAWNPHKIVFYAKNIAATRAKLIKQGIKMGKIWKFEKISFCDGTDCEGHKFQISNR